MCRKQSRGRVYKEQWNGGRSRSNKAVRAPLMTEGGAGPAAAQGEEVQRGGPARVRPGQSSPPQAVPAVDAQSGVCHDTHDTTYHAPSQESKLNAPLPALTAPRRQRLAAARHRTVRR